MRQRKCGICRQPASMGNAVQAWCTIEHGLELARKAQAKRKAAELAKERRETKTRRRALETMPSLLARVQRSCNAYIRARDKGKPCFTCGRLDDGLHQRHAGHYKAVGAGGGSPARFHPNNLRVQCSQCNVYGGGGNHPLFRARLVEEIGEEAVQAVERLHAGTIKWHRESVEQLGAWFAAEARAILKTTTETDQKILNERHIKMGDRLRAALPTYHVMPAGDLREHVDNDDCWCKPTSTWEVGGWLVVHNAADGREQYETGERKPH